MKILTKEQNLKLLKSGRFGNTLRMWENPFKALAQREYPGPFVIRSKSPGGPCVYEGLDTRYDLRGWIHNTIARQVWNSYVNERMPDQLITIQGEVWLGERSLFLFYSDQKGHMRPCLRKHSKFATGLAAKLLIDTYLPDHSEYIWDLMEEFPDHVVEFSAFSKGVGDRGWPLVIWEVRAY